MDHFPLILSIIRTAQAIHFSLIQRLPITIKLKLHLQGISLGMLLFFMVTTSNGGLDVSLSSDTLKPLLINLGVEENLVEINWKDLDLSSPDSIYRLYRSINNDDFVFSGSSEFGVGKLFDRVEYCEANASYRIEIMGDQGCTSVSNVANTSVLDQIAPKQTNLICGECLIHHLVPLI